MKRLSFRVPDLVHEALVAHCELTGKTQNQVFTEFAENLPVTGFPQNATLKSLLQQQHEQSVLSQIKFLDSDSENAP